MITLRNITLRRGTKVVLQNASVTLQPGEKVGLIGRNGAGKSSLFSLLTNRLHADAGDVEIPPRCRWRSAMSTAMACKTASRCAAATAWWPPSAPTTSSSAIPPT